MTGMFQGCKKLKSLDISNFNTSRVINMHYIFENCNSLTSLDLSNFNTTLAIDLGNIFYNCWSLTSIDVSNFVTISAQYIDYMFYNCTINSLNLSNFDTSKVTLMNNMFYNCTFLEELNLSSFDTHLVRNMQNMFYNCINLKYINLVNVKETNDLGQYYSNPFLNMFEGVPENIVFCINKNNAPNITYILEEKLCSINYCFDDWKNKQKEMFMINDEYKCEDNIQITTSISEFEETTNLISTYTIETQSHFYITEELISSNIEQAKYFSDYEYVNEPNDKENINNFSDRNNINNFAFKDIKTNHCIINIIYIKDSLSNNKLMEYIYDYINRISGNLGNLPVNHYINNNLNFTITIFKDWKCTNLLLNHGFFEITPSAIFDKLRKRSNYEKDYIFVYVNRIY
jgi:surface protein